jgi:heme peroxidase
MRQLALSMRSDLTRIPHALKVPPPKAGYTYFGQFIMHDLTQDDTPLSLRLPAEETEIVNHRTPFLDLDCLYGRGPFSEDAVLYNDDHASFKLGCVRTTKGVTFDVPLHPITGESLIADSRNSENLIVRQVHAMFLKLHNAALAEMRGKVPDAITFEKAGDRVRQQYQWLVRNDFLARVCNSQVYKEIVTDGKTAIEWDDDFAIPIEFAHAAGRFGHSMVRARYDLNEENSDVGIARIVREAHRPGGLDPSLAIDWKNFLRDPANAIDTTVVGALFELGTKAIEPFVERVRWLEPRELPVRTLYRNIQMKLPCGEDVREALDPGAILCDVPTDFPDYKPYQALDELGLRGKTPLWYYILLEAELGNCGFCDVTRGSTLGIIGSRLVAEVLEGALRATPRSILSEINQDPNWRPPSWNTPLGQLQIDTLLDLAFVVGLAE